MDIGYCGFVFADAKTSLLYAMDEINILSKGNKSYCILNFQKYPSIFSES